MEKDITVSVRGLSSPQDKDSEALEETSPGLYYRKGNKEYIVYTEYLDPEDTAHATKSTIRIEEQQVVISRAGGVVSQMVFAEGRSHLVYYHTPFGMMEMRILTHSLKKARQEHEIRLLMEYEMALNEQPRGMQKVEIQIYDRYYAG